MLSNCGVGVECSMSAGENETNISVREKVGVQEKDGLLGKVKAGKIRKYGHWKRRSNSSVLMTVEGERLGKGKRGRRRMGWIDNIAT